MRLCAAIHSAERRGGFTLIELLIASTVLLFVALALVSSNVTGARISSLVRQQTDGQLLDRRVTGLLKRDIAAAAAVRIGATTYGSLIEPAGGSPIVGNGIELVYETGGVTSRVYYVEDGTLWRYDNLDWREVVLEDLNDTQAFMLVDPASVINSPTNALARTNHAGRALVRIQLQLSTLGGQGFQVGPNTEFQANNIELFATQRAKPPGY
jgi:prepilin-type N-terminal cleavage/methylation domain-containing protein